MTTETKTIGGDDKELDVRSIPCSTKHPLILKTWFDLPVGDFFILVNGHDPVPLRWQFETEFGESVRWEYLEATGSDCRVKITKLAAVGPLALASPCGGSSD